MKRVQFKTEILGELAAAVDALADRYARFGMQRFEVVELCMYQGITKTRLGVERMERAAQESAFATAPLNV